MKDLACNGRTGEQREIGTPAVGNGSFGVFLSAQLVVGSVHPSGKEEVAIKKVLQDKQFKVRRILLLVPPRPAHLYLCTAPELRAPNYETADPSKRRQSTVLIFLVAYITPPYDPRQAKRNEVFLNLVIEDVPKTVYQASRHSSKLKQVMPILNIKLYVYQLLQSLAYVHSLGICHRDIKPQNLLLNPSTGVLESCDFGSAKILVAGEPNLSLFEVLPSTKADFWGNQLHH
ncbi:hypothetical protein PTTG_10427 [Puccinia triticina 1-1 BBBD Race 1]|uniref:Protein kinase domain-containing protein n=1 Tax=Puccinia triticina (isolate 1-1 / race 1 (BBBD)) TaxID=630390 RepID=A0A180G124_PUCT1|nr:hypothetical protein PTTG_10427 [Puccinia triticina 1-1 BBBD Race 1]